MNYINGYNEVTPYDGSTERLSPGGHICKVMEVRPDKDSKGNDRLLIALEIAEGSKYDGLYARRYKSLKSDNPNAKWPCVVRQYLLDQDGMCSPYFKGFIKSVEDSNDRYKWNWDEKTLAGRYVGVIFREEEFVNNNGEVRSTVKPIWFRSVQTIKDGVDVPEPKRVAKSNAGSFPGFSGQSEQVGFTEVSTDTLPF